MTQAAELAIPEAAESFDPALGVFFAPMDDAAVAFAMPIVHRLRGDNIRVEIEHRPKSMSAMLKRAAKLRARVAVIIGSNEIASGTLTVKDLAHSTQSEVSVSDLATKVRQLLD